MNPAANDKRASTSMRSSGDPRFAAEGRRFAPDKDALVDAIHVVRALDADSYQALLWALGLRPDPRLSVPGCGERRRAASGPAGGDSAA